MTSRIEIKKWMLDQGLTQVEIAKELGVSKSLVNKCISGSRKNPDVITALVERGCPEKYLDKSDASPTQGGGE